MPRLDLKTGLKKCSMCGIEKPPEEFPSHRGKPDGLNYSCCECVSFHQRPQKAKYREKNRSVLNAKNRIYAQRKRETDPIWVEKSRQWSKEYYHKNKKRLNKLRVIYARENPIGQKMMIRHREKRLGIILQFEPISKVELNNLYRLSGDQCFYCGKILGGEFHYDHYIPLAKGGKHIIENLRISCPRCNMKKRDTNPEEFIAKQKREVI